MSRALVRGVALVVVVLLAVLVPGSSAFAAPKPVVTGVSPSVGPAAATTVTVTGRNLSRVDAVLFGTRRGTSLKRVSATRLTVRTPAGAPAGSVAVRVHSGRVWSAVTAAGRYTVVGRPTVTRLSRTSGTYAGGDALTLTGTGLSTTRSVTIGGTPAPVVSKAASTVVVRTPAGVLGAAPVVVTALGGTSSSAPAFRYVTPPRRDTAAVTPVAGTMTAGAVQWVTGGLDPDTGTTGPWVVSLPASAPVPAVGQGFLVAPGNPGFPSGLTGTVTDVAEQVDTSVRVTVAPSDVDKTLSEVDLSYAGPVVAPAAARAVPPGRRSGPEVGVEGGRAASFELNGPTPFRCVRGDGAIEVAASVDLSLGVSNVQLSQHLSAGSLVSRPSYQGALTAEFTTTGKISVEGAATCTLRPSWQNAQRVRIPVGTSGLFVSFAPTLTLKVSAQGTWQVVDRTQSTFSVSAELGRTPSYSRSSRSLESRQGGAGGFQLEVSGGVSVQLGLLDRAGLQGKIEVGAAATLSAADHNVCVDGELFARISIGVYLDAVVARWEVDAFSVKLYLRALHGCAFPETPVSSDGPAITSTRLPDAQVGTAYSSSLSTADGRGGTWSVVSGALPAGLQLDPGSGEVSGTPSGAVGDDAFTVRFVDGSGAAATAVVLLRVQPSAAIGGGDLQFTLRWNGPADLDLHVTDPSGEEVYYGHSSSVSGGALDHDANAGCNGPEDDVNPVENIYWPQGTAPDGDYAAQVVTYAECDGPLDWTLVVRRRGVVILSQSGSGTSDLFHTVLGATAGSRVAPRTTAATPHHWPVKR